MAIRCRTCRRPIMKQRSRKASPQRREACLVVPLSHVKDHTFFNPLCSHTCPLVQRTNPFLLHAMPPSYTYFSYRSPRLVFVACCSQRRGGSVEAPAVRGDDAVLRPLQGLAQDGGRAGEDEDARAQERESGYALLGVLRLRLPHPGIRARLLPPLLN